jgi:hypothetical protein
MRWEDERYVKVYTRDTTDWLALSWKAQGLLCLILRKVDKAGILEVGKHGKRGLAAHLGGASAWVELEPVLEELLDDGCVEFLEDRLVVPNFIEAQEASQSDVARQRSKRERDRDFARAGVTIRDSASQNVTQSHALSRAVTPILSHPSDPSEEIPASAGAEPDGSGCSPVSEASSPSVAKLTPPAAQAPAPDARPADPVPQAASTASRASASAAGRKAKPAVTLALALGPEPISRGPVDEVYQTYMDGWRKHVSGTRPPVLSDKRRKLIRDQLRQFPIEDLKLACEGIWLLEFNMKDGHYAIDLVLRDAEHIERYRDHAVRGIKVHDRSQSNRGPIRAALPEVVRPQSDMLAELDRMRSRQVGE